MVTGRIRDFLGHSDNRWEDMYEYFSSVAWEDLKYLAFEKGASVDACIASTGRGLEMYSRMKKYFDRGEASRGKLAGKVWI